MSFNEFLAIWIFFSFIDDTFIAYFLCIRTAAANRFSRLDPQFFFGLILRVETERNGERVRIAEFLDPSRGHITCFSSYLLVLVLVWRRLVPWLIMYAVVVYSLFYCAKPGSILRFLFASNRRWNCGDTRPPPVGGLMVNESDVRIDYY